MALVPAAPATATARDRPQRDAETRDLLQFRLRAVAILFLVGTCAFAIRGILIGPADHVILVDQLFLEPALIGLILVLSRRRRMSLRTLRGLELAVFGVMIAHSVVVHWRMILILSRANDPIGVEACLRSAVLTTFGITVTYGFFVPNNWRRAMIVVVRMAAVPLLTGLIMSAIHPEVRDVLTPLLTPVEVSDDLLMMTIGIITAVIGAKVVHSLRKESFEARQLNQYQLGARLAVGGMGEVFLAEHRLLKRPCAIKLIRPGQDADPKVLERFEREVRETARLSHPNTIEIYDYGRAADGSFYYVMEYLSGLSFEDLVGRFGPLPAGRVIYLLRQACAALSEAHAFNLVHRDIKPANLFAARRGGLDDFVKLLDFGLVKPMTPREVELSAEFAIAGTPLYMAPEQARGERKMDARCDRGAL